MTKKQEQAVLDRATDKELRDSVVMLEHTFLTTEDFKRKITYGKAVDRMMREIHERIGDVDHEAIAAVYPTVNPADRAGGYYTRALFAVYPEFGAQ